MTPTEGLNLMSIGLEPKTPDEGSVITCWDCGGGKECRKCQCHDSPPGTPCNLVCREGPPSTQPGRLLFIVDGPQRPLPHAQLPSLSALLELPLPPGEGRTELSGREEASSASDVAQDKTLPSASGVVGNNRGCSRVVTDSGSSAPPAQFPSLSDLGLIAITDPGIGWALGQLHNIFKKAGEKYEMKPTYPDFPFTVYRSMEGPGDQEIEVRIRVTHYKAPGNNGSLDHRDPNYEAGEVEFGDAFTLAGKKITLTKLELETAEERFWQ